MSSTTLAARIKNAVRRRPTRVKVEITCRCGDFIPAAYTPGNQPSRYACERCGLTMRLSTFHGPVTW